MNLLVDLGNSRIKWSTPEELVQEHVASRSCADLQKVLTDEWGCLEIPDKIWISSVANANLTNLLTAWIKDEWNLLPITVRSCSKQLGVINGYEDPVQLGVDRWMAMIGARMLKKQACVIVDCGTATTIDSIDTEGKHLGGLILPGLQLMHEALWRNTAIPKLEMSYEHSVYAKDTLSGIKSAAILATGCLVNDVVGRLQERVGEETVCILTGGAGEELKDYIKFDTCYEPNLVLKGLALVAAQIADI